MTNQNHDAELSSADEVAETTRQSDASEPERGGLGLAALLWLLGVPGLIVLLFLLF